MPFKREQGKPPEEVQNGFKRRLAFCFLVVRGRAGAQFHMCRQGFSCIEFLSYNPHPGAKEGSTRASGSTFPNMGQREGGGLKAASRTSVVVQWLKLCAFTVEGNFCMPGGARISTWGLSCWLRKNLPAYAGDAGLIPGSERSPGKGNGTPLQYYSMGNSMSRRAWQTIVHGVTKELNMIYRPKSTWRQFPRFLGNLNFVLVLTWVNQCSLDV